MADWILLSATLIACLAAAISVFTYRQTSSIRTLDLRIEARVLREAVKLQLEHAKEYLEKSNPLFQAFFFKAGNFKPDILERRQEKYKSDKINLGDWEIEFEVLGDNLESSKMDQLEGLVEHLRHLNNRITLFIQEYKRDFAYLEAERIRRLKEEFIERQQSIVIPVLPHPAL